MKRDTLNYTQIGLFVIAATVVLLYALARISGHTQKHDIYFTSFHNITGVKEGSPVSFEGYEVGHVDKVVPVQEEGRLRYRLALAVKPGWRIPADSQAVITAAGLLSGQSVELRGGASPDALPPGGTIRGSDTPSMLAAVGALATELQDIARTQVRPTLSNLNQRIDRIGGLVEQKGPQTLDQLNGALARLDGAAAGVEATLNPQNRQHVNAILRGGDQLVGEFERSQADLRLALQQTQSILANLERASRHMSELSRRLRDNPSALLSSQPPTDPAEAAK